MNISDPRIRSEVIHGQLVYFVLPDAWPDILRKASLCGVPLAVPDLIDRWVRQYGQFSVAHLGLVMSPHAPRWWVVPMLRLDGHYYRVHFEDVMCEHCNQRCGASATPDISLYAGTNVESDNRWNEFRALPILSCPHCHGILRRRQTIWLAAQQ